MPRKSRIIIPGSVHHIMSRGLDGQVIFHDDHDREKMLSLFQKNLTQFKCSCYAWVLMDNHFHLLLRPSEPHLGDIMRRVNGGYARYYNAKYKRRGYLFQDRYKSLATQELVYLRELIRYIHLNPLRAGMVESVDELESYQWSGHRALLGLEKREWHDADNALSRFGRSRLKARKSYMQHLVSGAGEKVVGWRFALEEKGKGEEAVDERLAGDRAFIMSALSKVPHTRSYREEMRKNRPSLDALLSDTAAAHGIEKDRIMTRSWGKKDKGSIARHDFFTKAKRQFDYTLKEIAEFSGLDATTVCRAMQ